MEKSCAILLQMGRKRNLDIKDRNRNIALAKRKREEVVIRADSVIELANILSDEFCRKKVSSILVNYEGKENMDELLPHLLHSVQVDNHLASQIQQSLGVEVYQNYEDCYNSIDQIELEIYRIHANNNNNEECAAADTVTVPTNSQTSKTTDVKEKPVTDSGNSSFNSGLFVTDLGYTDMDIDALFMDILSTSNNNPLDNDRIFDGLPSLPPSPPPLPLCVMDPADIKSPENTNYDDSGSMSIELPSQSQAEATLQIETDKSSLETEELSPDDVERVQPSPTTTLTCSPEAEKDIVTPASIVSKNNDPLATSEPVESKSASANTVKSGLVHCDIIENLNINYNTTASHSIIALMPATTLESEEKSVAQNHIQVNETSIKTVKLSPHITRSRSKVIESEVELLQLIDVIDLENAGAENQSTDEEDEVKDGENEKSEDNLGIKDEPQSCSNSTGVWQPTVVLERIDPSKLAQIKEKPNKKVTVHQVRRCIANMKKIVKVEKPNIQQINEAMDITFAYRRKMVMDPEISVHAVLKEFPALSIFQVVKCECDRLLGDKLKTLEELLEENFVRAANSRKISSPHKIFVDARKAFKKTESDEIKKISGMVCLAFYLAEKQTVGSLFQLETKKKKVVKKLTPMMILEEADLLAENREIRIFADGTEMLKVPNFYEGVLTTYSLYYVLDIVYDKNVTLLFQYFDFLIGQPQSSFSTQPE